MTAVVDLSVFMESSNSLCACAHPLFVRLHRQQDETQGALYSRLSGGMSESSTTGRLP